MGIAGNPVYAAEIRTIDDGADANALTFNKPVNDLADRTAANKEAADARVHEFIKPYDVLQLTAGRVAIVNDFVAESPPLTKDLGRNLGGTGRGLTGDGQFLLASHGSFLELMLVSDLTTITSVNTGSNTYGLAGNGFKWVTVGSADGNGDTTHIYSHTLIEEVAHNHGGTLNDCDIDNMAVYIGGLAGTGAVEVRALAILDGAELWSFAHGATVYGVSCDGQFVHIVGDAGTGGAKYRKLRASDGVEITNDSSLTGEGRAVVHGGAGRVWVATEVTADSGHVIQFGGIGAPFYDWQVDLAFAPSCLHWDGTDLFVGGKTSGLAGRVQRIDPHRGGIKDELPSDGLIAGVWSDAHRLYAAGELWELIGSDKLRSFHLDGQSRRYHRLTGGGGHVLPYRGLVVPEVR